METFSVGSYQACFFQATFLVSELQQILFEFKPCKRCYISCSFILSAFVMVMLPDLFRGMVAWKNSTETQQLATSQGLNQRFPPLLREVGRNRETTLPMGPTIRSPPIVCPHLSSD